LKFAKKIAENKNLGDLIAVLLTKGTKMAKIISVKAREVFDSRGNPTVEAEVKTDAVAGQSAFRSMAPCGASTGAHEALELRDGGKRLMGLGVLNAVENVNGPIAKALVGKDPTKQAEIDKIMIDLDSTPNKEILGANAVVSVSTAVCRAGAVEMGMQLYEYIGHMYGCKADTLPIPQFNVINGGKHAGLEHDIQENMYMPVGASSFRDALTTGVEAYQSLKKILKGKFGPRSIQLGDEGGFVPNLNSPYERLSLLKEAAEKAGHPKLPIAIDAASTEFYNKYENTYKIGKTVYDSKEMVEFWKEICAKDGIVSLEDGMAEDDWHGWALLTKELGDKVQITGDDLLVTNVHRIKMAIEKNACNSLLLKVNQIGTVTESLAAAKMAQGAGWRVTVSHRSGETEGYFIADLAVGIGASQIKSGAPARSERLAKYNQLLRIEERLGSKAKYAGKEW
jgi:enolase